MPGRYTVQGGDTLSGIAKRFGLPLDVVIRMNPQIKNPNLIHPGESIRIPNGSVLRDTGRLGSQITRNRNIPPGAAAGSRPAAGTPAPSTPAAGGPAPGPPPRDAVDRIIDRTSKYEGNYTSLNRNTDGAGLSFGFIQFAQKPGSLGGALQQMHDKNPEKFRNIFGPESDRLLSTTQSKDEATRMSMPLWQEPWASRFQQAGADPEFQGVQRDRARKQYFEPMMRSANYYGIKSERGLSMLYDTAVQQGVGGLERVMREAAAQRPAGASEKEFLGIVANTAANNAGRWHDAVLRRRTGILNDPGLSDGPPR